MDLVVTRHDELLPTVCRVNRGGGGGGQYPHRKPDARTVSVCAPALCFSLHLPLPSPLGKRFAGALNPGLSTGASSLILRSTGVERERDDAECERGERESKQGAG